jgi:hypothetical protein
MRSAIRRASMIPDTKARHSAGGTAVAGGIEEANEAGEREEAAAAGELMAAYEALYGRDEQQEGGITRERKEGRKREREEEAGAWTAVTTPSPSGKRRGLPSIASPRFQPTPGGEGQVSEPTPTSERSRTSPTAPTASESVVDTAAHASNTGTNISTSNMSSSSSNMGGGAVSLKPRKLVMPARSRTSA